jgi:hypothetical protein
VGSSTESAKFNLNEVKELAKCTEKHFFSKTRAIDHVVTHLQISAKEAQDFILNEISNLTEGNFSHRNLIHRNVYDVYGKRIIDIPWYIKFSILNDDNGNYLSNISFHPTERELITQIEVLEMYCP